MRPITRSSDSNPVRLDESPRTERVFLKGVPAVPRKRGF